MTDLGALYAKLRPALLASARRRTRDVHAAEDLVQEAWLCTLKTLKANGGEVENFRSYLEVAMRSVYCGWHHRKQPGLLESEPVDPRSWPNREAERWRALYLSVAVESAVASLPKHLRSVTGPYLRGYKLREIAQILGLPEGTVKRRMFTARNLLRDHPDLAEYHDEAA